MHFKKTKTKPKKQSIVNKLDDKDKDKSKSHSINFDGNVDLPAVASDALRNKGTVGGSVAAAAPNLNGGRISLNNNNDSNTHDKNTTSKSLVLGDIDDVADAFNDGIDNIAKTNGGGDNGAATHNNGQHLDNFADFDAFSSVTPKDFDPFASADPFPDTIGLNSTRIDGGGGIKAAAMPGANSMSNKSASAAAKDRFFSDSLSNTITTTTTTKRGTITATALAPGSNGGGTNGRRNSKGANINDYFDAKFDSFMTTAAKTTAPKDDSTAAADLANANPSKTKASPFGLDDDEFADFNNANIFKATFDTTDSKTNTSQFDLAFQPSPTSTIKSTKSTKSTSASAFLPLPPPAGKNKSGAKSNSSLSSAFDCDNNKKNVKVTTAHATTGVAAAAAMTTAAAAATDEPEKVPTKFRQDYSKTDQFEDDLQEVLKRSMVDQ